MCYSVISAAATTTVLERVNAQNKRSKIKLDNGEGKSTATGLESLAQSGQLRKSEVESGQHLQQEAHQVWCCRFHDCLLICPMFARQHHLSKDLRHEHNQEAVRKKKDRLVKSGDAHLKHYCVFAGRTDCRESW